MTLIQQASPSSTSIIANIMGLSFRDLAAAGWLIPRGGTDVRGKILASYFREPIEEAIKARTVYVNQFGTAAAVWFPQKPTGYENSETRRERVMNAIHHEERVMEAVGGRLFDRFMRFERAREEAYPDDLGEHWYLPIIGVHPNAQRRGHGTALLNAVHNQLNQQGLSAYLEATSPELTDYYSKFGYKPVSDPIVLDGEPLLWPMARFT